MRRPSFVILVTITAVAVLCLALAGHVRYYSSDSRLPVFGDRIERISGLESVVEIRIDRYGVPHVKALGEADLWFSVGYLHARERFFQMDMYRRLAQGRLAEIYGEVRLESDRAMRTLRIGSTAQSHQAQLTRSELAVFQAYTDGVNAALEQFGPWIAGEVWLMGIDPELWTITDSLSIGVLLDLSLSDAGRREVQRAIELGALGRERALDLWGWTPQEARQWMPPQPPSPRSALAEAILPESIVSSSAWAVSGNFSESGKPLLASSSSTSTQLPVPGYGLHIASPGFEVAGVSLPGAPAVLYGHTQEVAWAVSPVGLDNQDLFYLTLDSTRSSELVDGSWQPLRTVTESILVRERDEPELLKVRISKHGPIVADDGRTVLALAWTGHYGPSPLAAFLRMNRADSVADVASAWSESIAPALHIVAADQDGRLLHQIAGRVPIRGRGAGRLPSPGENSRWDWQGFLPFSANPRTLDPPSGQIAVAGHDLFFEGDYPRRMRFPAEFTAPWQARRIREKLQRSQGWTTVSALEMGTDVTSGRARALLQLIGPQLDQMGGPVAESLLGWNGAMDVDSTAAAAYARLVDDLTEAIGGDDARAVDLPFNPIDRDRLITLLAGGIDDDWWDDLETSEVEDRDKILRRVLRDLDAEPAASWGSLHKVSMRHPLDGLPLFGSLIGRLFSRGPFPTPGDETTVNLQPRLDQVSTVAKAAPAMRFVASTHDWDETIMILASGQSGRLWSVHFDDHLEHWLKGEPVPLVFSESAINELTAARLRLEPIETEETIP